MLDGTIGASQLDDTLDLSAKTVTLPAASVTAHAGTPTPISGAIIQTKYFQYTGTTSTDCANNVNQTLDHIFVKITPTSTNSIIRIDAMVNGEWSYETATYNSTWFFYRDTTKLSHAVTGSQNVGVLMGTAKTQPSTDVDSTPETAYYSYFDTPSSTSELTYKVAVNQGSGTGSVTTPVTWYTNRTVSMPSTDYQYELGTSFICVTEIAG